MAFKVFVVSCLLALASAVPLEFGFGNLNLESRVVGGDDAKVGEFPHQVSLQVLKQHFCGGSIIAPQWILTAGHCVLGAAGYEVIVKAGKHNIDKLENSEQTLVAVEAYVHPKYEGDVGPYDIALLKLEGPLKLNKRVAAVKLPKQGVNPKGDVVISGWGSISKTPQAVQPSILQRATMPLIDNNVCFDAVKKLSNGVDPPLDKTNICTGPLSGGTSACRGDSGGPLVSQSNDVNELVGIVSWGMFPCGSAGAPSVFVKVADFIDWIGSTIDENSH